MQPLDSPPPSAQTPEDDAGATSAAPQAACPMLLLMKGHPGSGKSTLAHSLASSLRWPLIDKDDIRDATLPLEFLELPLHTGSAAGNAGQASGKGESAGESSRQEDSGKTRGWAVLKGDLNELAYQAMWNVAARQLSVSLSAVVDCPLAHHRLLQQGQNVAERYGARVAVLECLVSDESEWRRRVEDRASQGIALARGASVPQDSASACWSRSLGFPQDLRGLWHKPASWADVQELLERYGGCWQYSNGHVPHLVVDTAREPLEACLPKAIHWLRGMGYSSLPTARLDEHWARVKGGG